MNFDLVSLPLSEIASFKYGKTIRKQDIEVAGTYPVHSGYKTVGYLPTYMYEDKQLLIVCRGAGGTGDIKMSPPQVSITNLAIVISCDESKVCKEYLYWVLKLADTYSLRTGSAQPQITINSLDSFNVTIHRDLDVQKEIATFLNTLNSKISINMSINQTLEEMAQAIFKSWFVDFDPVKAKMNGEQPEGMDVATASLFPEKLVESELGLIPEGWEATNIDNATSKVFSGGTPSTKNEAYWGGDLPWFSSGETRNNFIIETEKHITQEGVDGSSTKASAYGDVLIASAGQGHTRGQTSFNSIDCYINQSVVALRASDSVSPYWLYYCLERRYDEMRSVSDSHSSRGSLTTKLLKALPIAKPSKEIVNAFDTIVESLVRRQIANANQNKELSLLRDTLIPKLLLGEIELGATEAMEPSLVSSPIEQYL
ncbi:restriction endonuclease subunit S [Vibrio vulnificus]|uniref:restriction endonuclease subunit S n=1 Tax=Vibrio vulnificus TaxID=672 RepID=UPI001028ED1B|nr:restriction endonuclease subunit S [Vibrio vulnificus]RZQ02757.1 restriction endonuclease subunit S [Vibrio vulnificus]